MRPEIPESLEQRIENIYEEAGYASGTELVRDAVRRWVDELEQKYPKQETEEYPDLEYTVSSNTKLVRLKLAPTENSELRIGDSGGQHQSKPTLYSEDAMIKNSTVKSALEDISGVQNGGLTHTGEVKVEIPHESERDINMIVDDVFQTIYNLIQRKESPVEQVKQATSRYAEKQDSF